jgi:periplasmic divalent cation tolerance protein
LPSRRQTILLDSSAPTGEACAVKTARSFAVVLVTAPDLKTGRALAKSALEARLAACVNLLPRIESHYWWSGRIESSAEVLLVLKTNRAKIAALERTLLARHPYETPEFVALPLTAGNRRYLDWLLASLATPEPRRPRTR